MSMFELDLTPIGRETILENVSNLSGRFDCFNVMSDDFHPAYCVGFIPVWSVSQSRRISMPAGFKLALQGQLTGNDEQ